MLSAGNGTAQQCAYNLVRTFAGEVPMARGKGIKRELIDSPMEGAGQALRGDIEDVLMAYEPRINLNKVSLTDLNINVADMLMNVSLEGANDQ